MNWRPKLLRSVCLWLNAGLVCFSLYNPSLTHAITAPKPVEKSVRVYLNPNTGRFWTMDSYAGSNSDPLSLHKYYYAHDDPVMNTDPTGHESLSGLSVSLSVVGGFFAQAGFRTTPTGALATGSTCGPDVTAAVFATAKDVDNTWFAAGRGQASGAALEAYSPLRSGGNRWWDVQKLNDVGAGDTTIDFGNGSSLGTGLIGKQTVQFSNSRPGVYYAGSVNYFLWGKIFSLAYHTLTHPLTGAHDPAYSETAAVAFAKAHKWDIGSRGTDYEKQAVAFVRFGFSGTDPSSTALTSVKPNPSNVASSSRFLWKWLGLHDTLQ